MAKRRIAYGRCLGALVILAVLGILLYAGIWLLRIYTIYQGEAETAEPDPEIYTVLGVDVSCYQGNVDWEVIASQNITFAFIKATEGSSFTDPNFHQNWEDSARTSIYTGAYHFFSFESGGSTQAENFIAAVGELGDRNLPPVVDIELYGEYNENPPDAGKVRRELRILLDALEEHYGVRPIIYAPEKTYFTYIFGAGFEDSPMWIANTRIEPLPRWDFWQYTVEGRLEGYDGMKDAHTEGHIDLNVYKGTYEAFLDAFGLEEAVS